MESDPAVVQARVEFLEEMTIACEHEYRLTLAGCSPATKSSERRWWANALRDPARFELSGMFEYQMWAPMAALSLTEVRSMLVHAVHHVASCWTARFQADSRPLASADLLVREESLSELQLQGMIDGAAESAELLFDMIEHDDHDPEAARARRFAESIGAVAFCITQFDVRVGRGVRRGAASTLEMITHASVDRNDEQEWQVSRLIGVLGTG